MLDRRRRAGMLVMQPECPGMTEPLVQYLAARLGAQTPYPDWWMVRHLLRRRCVAAWRSVLRSRTVGLLRDPAQVLRFSLAGLPEWRRFPSEATRRRALRELAEVQRASGGGRTWIVLAALATIAAAAGYASAALLTVSLPTLALPTVVFWLRLIVMVRVFWSLLRRVQRVGAAARLRLMLTELHVAVCLGCGYSLYGHDRSARRCPECGRAIDERVRQTLNSGNQSRVRAATIESLAEPAIHRTPDRHAA